MGLALMAALAPTVVLADTYPIEVPAYSTYYKYFPAQQGNAALGEWNATTTVANWTIGQSGQINWAWGGDAYQFAYGVEGDSAPSVEYSYTGGDCTIFGWWGIPGDEGTTGAIDVEVDGTSTTYTSPDNLGTLSTTHEIITTIPLEVAAHTIKITVRQGTFSFYGLQVQWEFPDVS